jgi:hypothetical protein
MRGASAPAAVGASGQVLQGLQSHRLLPLRTRWLSPGGSAKVKHLKQARYAILLEYQHISCLVKVCW